MKFLSKGIKDNRKMLFTCLIISVVVSCMSVGAMASTTITDVMTTAFSSLVSDLMAMAMAIIPTCIGILGLTVSVGFAVKWFKKLTGVST